MKQDNFLGNCDKKEEEIVYRCCNNVTFVRRIRLPIRYHRRRFLWMVSPGIQFRNIYQHWPD